MNIFFATFKTWYPIIILFFIFTLINSNKAIATHLIGGNIGYQYIGPDPNVTGNVQYRIILDSYMDCNSSSWGTTFPENSVNVGIYEGVLNPTSAIPNSSQLSLNLIDSNAVDPNLPPICNPFNLLGGVCVYIVRYEATVSLSPSTAGYWVVYDRCCRPSGIINLNNSGNQGFSYTTWIPADSTGIMVNNSAQFTDTLLSYICRTDTAYISNSATDQDGDSLVYSLVSPFKGVTGTGVGGSPNPSLPYNSPLMNPYTIPPAIVNWASGYNLQNLLGIGSYSSTNSQTGLTKFLTNNSGIYVATVEIKEYRNGQVVGITRRNMQLIADNCPNNNMPNQNVSVLDSSAISPLVYQINAGDSFCFSLNYDDLDGDPLEFTATGDIFDPTLTNPAATATSPTYGIGSVTGTICWATACDQGSTIPYQVQVVVVDSNCPPLPLPQDLLIYVHPFTGLNNIIGDSLICVTNNPSIFSTNFISGATYNWTITNGAVVSGAGSSSVGIVWNNNQSSGIVSVTATNSLGCTIGPIIDTVILSNVVADAGPDVFVCDGDSVQIGGTPTSLNVLNNISWSPSNTLNFDSVANPMASPTVYTTYIVTLTNSFGCIGHDTVNVDVNFLQPTGLLDEYYVCPGDTTQATAAGSVFDWSPNIFINDSTFGNPIFSPTITTQYFLNYLDSNGCAGLDSIILTVNDTVPTFAGVDTQICVGDSVAIGGNPTSPPGTTFNWTPNASLNSNTDGNPIAHPLNTTIYTVHTFNDTCTGTGSVTVTVNQLPSLSTSVDTILCLGDSTQITALGTGNFSWDNGTSLTNDTIFNPIAFPISPTLYTVTLTDSNGCVSEDSVQIDIQNLPLIDAGGIINACKLNPINIGGNPTASGNVTYVWSPSTNLNDTSISNPIFYADHDMVYNLVVTDSLGCQSTDSVEVLVFLIQGLGDTVLCAKEKYTLTTSRINGIGPFIYQWSNDSDLSIPNSASPFVYTGNSNTYTVTVTDGNGCKDTTQFNISLLAGTTSDFSHQTEITCNGITVQVKNLSSDAVDYEWFMNGESVSSEEEPNLLFPYGKNVTLTLITTSVDGCTDTAEVVIPSPSFENSLNITTTNVFTPNGDGENDYFSVNTAGNVADCADLKIYNRNGVLVYQSNGGIFSWDGYSQTGKPFPEGVYYFVYSVNGIERHGNITLLR